MKIFNGSIIAAREFLGNPSKYSIKKFNVVVVKSVPYFCFTYDDYKVEGKALEYELLIKPTTEKIIEIPRKEGFTNLVALPFQLNNGIKIAIINFRQIDYSKETNNTESGDTQKIEETQKLTPDKQMVVKEDNKDFEVSVEEVGSFKKKRGRKKKDES